MPERLTVNNQGVNSSGDWYEGIHYNGDKSFSIELNADDCFNEVDGVTVTNCTFEALS